MKHHRLLAGLALLMSAPVAPSSAATCSTIVANDLHSHFSILSVQVLATKDEPRKFVYDGLESGAIYPGHEAAITWDCTGSVETYKIRAFPSGPGRNYTLPAVKISEGKVQFIMN